MKIMKHLIEAFELVWFFKAHPKHTFKSYLAHNWDWTHLYHTNLSISVCVKCQYIIYQYHVKCHCSISNTIILVICVRVYQCFKKAKSEADSKIKNLHHQFSQQFASNFQISCFYGMQISTNEDPIHETTKKNLIKIVETV